MLMNIEDLDASHLKEACGIFEAAFRKERCDAPILDETFGTAARVMPKLLSCIEKTPGVAVTENGKLVAYMTGIQIEKFLSPHRGVYSPEWAHGSIAGNDFELYRLMYRELGQRWVENGCITHAINFMNHSVDAWNAFVWNGFGGICFDAIRPVEKLNAEIPGGIRISQLEEKDIAFLLPLVDASARHLAASPSFVPYTEPETLDALSEALKTPGNHAWMAWSGSEPVGYMKVTPAGNGAAWIVNGERKFAINGAYVNPEFRGRGIARHLLSSIMDWGLEQGFARCSVDFEMTNPEACGFWLKHFRPVCRSMVRRLDEDILKTI